MHIFFPCVFRFSTWGALRWGSLASSGLKTKQKPGNEGREKCGIRGLLLEQAAFILTVQNLQALKMAFSGWKELLNIKKFLRLSSVEPQWGLSVPEPPGHAVLPRLCLCQCFVPSAASVSDVLCAHYCSSSSLMCLFFPFMANPYMRGKKKIKDAEMNKVWVPPAFLFPVWQATGKQNSIWNDEGGQRYIFIKT